MHGALRAHGRRAEALRCALERFLGGELGLVPAANLSKDKKKPQPLETEEVQTP